MRYIYDVTQLIHWPGNLTGIPRVMDELAIRFLKEAPDDTVFVSWVKEVGELCEVNFETTRTHRGHGIDYVTSAPTQPVAARTAPNSVDTPKILDDFRSTVKRGIKKVARVTGVSDTKAYGWLKKTTHTIQAQSYKVYQPSKGDRLFIPWGEWWDPNWLKKVQDLSVAGVTVFPVCHDILPMVVPQFSGNSSSLADFVKQVFPISHTVVVPSLSTKNDLEKWMAQNHLTVPEVAVIAWGEDFEATEASVSESAVTKKYDIKKDEYIIAVSTIEPRKNHALLYYTYKLAASRGIKLPKLLIIGKVGHDTSEIIKFIKEDPEVNDAILICDFVNDSELNWLYQNCMFTVSASFYEGLGMSILESIMRGKPGVCSSTSSLGEISDEYVIHFNPASTDECLEAINRMSDPKVRSTYIKRVTTYKPKLWDATYKQLIKIMEK